MPNTDNTSTWAVPLPERSVVDASALPAVAPAVVDSVPVAPVAAHAAATTTETKDKAEDNNKSNALKRARAQIAAEMGRFHPPSRLPEMKDVVMSACAELEADMLHCIHYGSFTERASLCQQPAAKFWKCVEDSRHVLRNMGYHKRVISDEQRVVMAN
ncbi:hypothetical protein BC828DRAFT_274805 [Blastocladiella britannica]|nr:hypothetical protein BC828DRAFT_274805 [Blastocladiella britannica]